MVGINGLALKHLIDIIGQTGDFGNNTIAYIAALLVVDQFGNRSVLNEFAWKWWSIMHAVGEQRSNSSKSVNCKVTY